MSAKGHQSQGGKGAASAQLEREAEPQLCSKSSPSWHPPQSNLRTRRLGLESFHLASRKKGKCHTVPTPGKWNSVRAQNNTKDTQEQWKTSWILLSQPHFTQKDTKFPWHLYRRNVLRSAYTTCLSVSLQTLDGKDLESRNEPFLLPLWTITEIFEKIVIRVDPKVNSVIISRYHNFNQKWAPNTSLHINNTQKSSIL